MLNSLKLTGLPAGLIQQITHFGKTHLISVLGSMEEAEKQSKSGKQRSQFIGMSLNNIDKFKENHLWKLWNVFHKRLFKKPGIAT